MKKVKALLKPHLEALHPRVFFDKAPKNETFPYLVVSFSSALDDGEGRITMPVDIDGWDDQIDTTRLEALMDTVANGLNKQVLTDGETKVVFYRDSILSLTDDEPRIRRRKHIYQAHVYGRS